MSKPSSGLEYSKVAEIRGPLLVVDGVERAAFDELVEIEDGSGNKRLARVLETGFGKAVVQVFEGTSGLSVSGTRARFLGKTMELPVSDQLLGRVFDGLGKPLDGLPEPMAKSFLDVNGAPINPERRDYPTDLIQTGVSVIDGMLTLVRGQKLPIFSGAGMPHNMLAAQIARQATVVGEGEEFAVVFAAVGVSHSDASFFQRTLAESGAIRRSVLYLNLADDPAIERIITPRVALTAAEYLAYELGMHVLVIITDITNYCFRGDTEVVMGDGTIMQIGKYVESMASSASIPASGVPSASGQLLLLNNVSLSRNSLASAFSWDGFKTRPSRIVSVQKVMAPKEMVYVRTRSGAELNVTRDHKVLVDTLSGPRLVAAEDLKKGMELYSVRKFDIQEKQPSILEFFLEDDGDFYFHLKDDEIERRLSAKYGSLRAACERLSLKYEAISDSYQKRRFEASELLAASSALALSLKEASSRVDYVTAGGKARLYISEPQLTPRWLRILGWVASDGTIYENETQGIYYVSFTNRNRQLIDRFLAEVTTIFPGIDVRVDKNQDGVLMARVNSRALSHIFGQLLLRGRDDELVPVFKLSEQNIAAFLSGYLDGDGSIPRNRKLVQYTAASKLRAKRLQQLLRRLGIQSVIQERDSESPFGPSHAYDVVIRGRENLQTFGQMVEPCDPSKLRRLQALKTSFARQKVRRGEYFDLAPLVCSDLFRSLRRRHGIKAGSVGKSSTMSQFEHHKRRVSKPILREWLAAVGDVIDQSDPEYQKPVQVVDGNFILDRITEAGIVKNTNHDYVYDFTVSDTHKIVTADGIVSSNCEALREISAAREEVPGRKGFPGYLYTDLATNYERAGRIKGRKGSITQMPILTMPSDDVTHPIPDLTGYITEGQIFLGRELFRKGIYPPVYVLSSLSRLMGPALGVVIKQGRARADHHQVGNQLYNAYARAVELRALAEIVGKSGLTGSDLKYLQFGDDFEQKFLNQGYDENRTFEDTTRIAWETLSILPQSELTNIKEEFIKKYYVGGKSAE
ncbi:MAG: V-type ATP synthase subunit B [Nitrososphaerales archaeon]|nr:V-type ATP synthase subunit B [Nitrososphaerales archaeon]